MRIASWLMFAVVLEFAPAHAAPQWRALPTAPVMGRIEDLHFLDANTGWIALGGGYIYRTGSGGVSWELQHENHDQYFRCIRFANPQRGWFGTLSSDALLHETSDGGANWTLVTGIPEPRPNAICGLWVVSSLVVYGVGSYSGPARMIKTTDGGATWSSKDLAPLASTLVDVYFKSPIEGFAVGSVGTFPNQNRAVVLQTTDGGVTWQQRHVGTRMGEWCWKISFPTPTVGYVSLERFAGPMFVLKTEDAGLTWSELPFPNENEQGIGFASIDLGWVGGSGNPTYGTTDRGATWTLTPWGEDLNRFQFLSSTLGYASGMTVYKYSEDAVAVDATNHQNGSRAAPNPFGQRTTIRFALERTERVQLLVADPTGRVVRTLEDGIRSAGSYVVNWDGRNDAGKQVSAGIYLYVLHAGERHEMGKLVRIR